MSDFGSNPSVPAETTIHNDFGAGFNFALQNCVVLVRIQDRQSKKY
jgi:hypothetical protein